MKILTDILREIEVESARIAQGKASLSLLDKVENGRLKVQQGIIADARAATLKKRDCCGAGITWSILR